MCHIDKQACLFNVVNISPFGKQHDKPFELTSKPFILILPVLGRLVKIGLMFVNKKKLGSSFEQTKISFTQGCALFIFLVKIGLVICKWRFWNIVNIFRLFHYNLTLGKTHHYDNKLPSPRGFLCHIGFHFIYLF